MHLLYFLKEGSNQIECLDYITTFDGSKSVLEDLARDLVLKENGEKRAIDAFVYPLEKLNIYDTPDGLHLMKNTENGQIFVYQKSTKLVSGLLYGLTPVVSVTKVGTFCIVEMKNFKKGYSVDNIIKSETSKNNKTPSPSLPFMYIEELKTKLINHKSKSFEEIEEFLEINKKLKNTQN